MVETGVVEGIPAADPRITVFKGIPFAAPPVGELRWRAPQPAKPWVGVLKADHFGPIAMQEVPGKDPNAFYSKEWHVDPDIPMSEDCLQLNVWTPAKNRR
jgi:para-nitrobenzyl esterase